MLRLALGRWRHSFSFLPLPAVERKGVVNDIPCHLFNSVGGTLRTEGMQGGGMEEENGAELASYRGMG
jgi:hypothetical protein